jgi:hypothetical protein
LPPERRLPHPRLANGLSGAHSQAMEYIFAKIVDFLIAVCVASMFAITLGFAAHYLFGLSRLDIRTSALIGAGIFALVFAPASGDRVARRAAKTK